MTEAMLALATVTRGDGVVYVPPPRRPLVDHSTGNHPGVMTSALPAISSQTDRGTPLLGWACALNSRTKERRSRLVTALPLPSEGAASLGDASSATTPTPCLPLCGPKLAGLTGSSPRRSRSGLVELNHTTGRGHGVRPYTPHLICALPGECGFVSPVMRD